jgi:hypothetical protein
MIEQAAIRLPIEKQSAFFDRVTASCSGSSFPPPAAWPTATSPTQSSGH